MPTLDLILFPLLAGYIYLTNSNYYKYLHQRIESQRLVLNALIAGILITLVGIGVDFFYLRNIQPLREFLKHLIPIKRTGFNLGVLVFFISWPLALIMNWINSDNKNLTLNRVIKRWGDDYEKLFWRSMQETIFENKGIMVTTNNDKVYVGHITNAEPNNIHITIIPYFSGYRKAENKKFIITTDYLGTLEDMFEDDVSTQIDKRLGIVLPINTIVSATKFDWEVFNRFNTLPAVD